MVANIRILHVPPYAPPIEGGSERFCFNLSKSLAKRGHNIRVMTSIKGNKKFDYVEGIPCNFYRNYWHMLKLNPLSFLYQDLPDIVDWADIVHVHSYIYFLGNQVALYRKLREFPFILHLHGGTSPIGPEVYGWRAAIVKKFYDATVGKWSINTADCLLASSQNDVNNAINRFSANPDHITHIPNSVFVDNFYSDPSNPPVVTFLARLTQLKGCLLLPTIIKRVHKERKDAIFWIVGEGYLEKFLHEELEGLPVKFWGGVPHSQVPEIFAKSSISFLPSYTESCPLGILESMASSVPVVASNVGGIPEIIEEGRTGFTTDTENVLAMAERIVWLLDNDKERIDMGRRGRKFVEDKHSWGKTTTMIENIYEELI